MVWTLVYILITQGGGGTLQTDIWESGLVFDTQPACIALADKAAPDLLKGRGSLYGPSGGTAGPAPNVTVQPACLPTVK